MGFKGILQATRISDGDCGVKIDVYRYGLAGREPCPTTGDRWERCSVLISFTVMWCMKEMYNSKIKK